MEVSDEGVHWLPFYKDWSGPLRWQDNLNWGLQKQIWSLYNLDNGGQSGHYLCQKHFGNNTSDEVSGDKSGHYVA